MRKHPFPASRRASGSHPWCSSHVALLLKWPNCPSSSTPCSVPWGIENINFVENTTSLFFSNGKRKKTHLHLDMHDSKKYSYFFPTKIWISVEFPCTVQYSSLYSFFFPTKIWISVEFPGTVQYSSFVIKSQVAYATKWYPNAHLPLTK